MYSISIVRKTNYCQAALVLKSQNRWPYFEIMSILHRQKAFVQMDLIAESGPIYMEIQTCTILHNRVCWYTGSVRTECSCHSLGDYVNASKTVQSLVLFQYKVSSTREVLLLAKNWARSLAEEFSSLKKSSIMSEFDLQN